MDSLLSDNGGVTGLCKGKSKQARLRFLFLFRSIKISSLEHWRQSFGKVKWIVLYFNDTIHIIRDKRGEESDPHINIFHIFCLFLIDKKRVRMGSFKSGASISRKVDNAWHLCCKILTARRDVPTNSFRERLWCFGCASVRQNIKSRVEIFFLLVFLFHDDNRYLEKYGDHTNRNCKEAWSEAGVFFGLV